MGAEVMASAIHNEIAEKRRTLRGIYGGMMSLTELTHELGLKDKRVAKAWALQHGIGNQIGRWVKFDTDMVAKHIVMGRGMV